MINYSILKIKLVIHLRLSLISLKKCGPAPTVLRKMSSTKS